MLILYFVGERHPSLPPSPRTEIHTGGWGFECFYSFHLSLMVSSLDRFGFTLPKIITSETLRGKKHTFSDIL